MADGGGLENRYGVKPIVGSNPTPSATEFRIVAGVRYCRVRPTCPSREVDADVDASSAKRLRQRSEQKW